jgi:hypothetical protein
VSLSETVTVEFPLQKMAPKSARGAWKLTREQDHHGVASEHAGDAAEDGVLAITFGGFPFQLVAAFLEGRFDGPPLRVALDHRLRLQREAGRQERLVAMGPCPSWP